MQIQKVAHLLGVKIKSAMVVLASVQQTIQQVATDLSQDLSTEIVLAKEELNGAASTWLWYTLCKEASSFNSLSDKTRRAMFTNSWGSSSELVGMPNKDYPHPTGEVPSRVTWRVQSVPCTFFDGKQQFEQLKRDQGHGSGHALPWLQQRSARKMCQTEAFP